MNVTIDGQQPDFSEQQYQLQDDYFHFERRDGTKFHVHGQGVTLEYALETLGIGVTDTSLSHGGSVYNDTRADQRVVYEVNGEGVNPETYVLQGDDEVVVIAETVE
jgi:hypothetical protein